VARRGVEGDGLGKGLWGGSKGESYEQATATLRLNYDSITTQLPLNYDCVGASKGES